MLNLMPMTKQERGLWNYFDNWERNFFDIPLTSFVRNDAYLRTDVTDEGDKFVLSAELPGFQREDIQIDLNGDLLTIQAKREEVSEEEKDHYIRKERRCGSFARSFDVSGINTQAIAAAYENGVLTLTLPKQEAPAVPPARQIEIAGPVES